MILTMLNLKTLTMSLQLQSTSISRIALSRRSQYDLLTIYLGIFPGTIDDEELRIKRMSDDDYALVCSLTEKQRELFDHLLHSIM